MFDIETLDLHFSSGMPAISIETLPVMEADLIERLVAHPAGSGRQPLSNKFDIYRWDCRQFGNLQPITLRDGKVAYGPPIELEGRQPEQMVNFIRYLLKVIDQQSDERSPRQLFIVKDILKDIFKGYDYPQQISYFRNLQELITLLKNTQHRLALLHFGVKVPEEFRDLIWEMNNPLPNEEEVKAIQSHTISNIIGSAKANRVTISISTDLDHMTRALQGLTPDGIKNSLKLIGLKHRAFDDGGVKEILDLKKKELTKRGVTFAEAPDVPIQGLTRLTGWAYRNAALLNKQEREKYNLPKPSNVLLVGAPGTGKSLAVKAIAQQWGIPCLALDMGKLMTKELGGSEANLRFILRQAEALAPCILWVDEMDKQLTQQGGESDGGTTSRMIGSILTWLEENRNDVVVIGTANRPKFSNEMYRRFKVFLVGMPDSKALEEIWKVQLERYMISSLKERDIKNLASNSEDLTGDDVRKIVLEAATEAFSNGTATQVTFEALRDKIQGKRKLSNNEFLKELKELNEWAASGMAEFANG